MRIGTKSVLFGAHCFFIHPWFVAVSWWKLFGVPLDPRLWVAFFVHDLGYWRKPNMDGPEGETHVELGAIVMDNLFGPEWGRFSRYHSRFYSKRDNVKPSKLCIADKLAICITPAWLYLPMTNWTGEIHEYMKASEQKEGRKYHTMKLSQDGQKSWYLSMQRYVRAWVEEHKDGWEDTWTPQVKTANIGR